MKTYTVELRRTSFVTLTVEADTQEQAEQMAWDEIMTDGSYGSSDADWEIGFVDEVK